MIIFGGAPVIVLGSESFDQSSSSSSLERNDWLKIHQQVNSSFPTMADTTVCLISARQI
jgi:hypothetical protein